MTSKSSPAVSLADEFVTFRLATEHDWALWAGDLTHLEEWPELSDAGRRARIEGLTNFAARASSIDADSPDERILLETISFTGRSQVVQRQWETELEWVNHTGGIWSLILTFLPLYPLVTEEHGERYLEKLRRLPGFLDSWADLLARAAGDGIAPIRHLVTAQIALIDRHLAQPLSSGPLGQVPPPARLPAEQRDRWPQKVGELVDGAEASLRRVRSTLADQTLPVARDDQQPGLLHLPGGRELYDDLVRAHTTLDHAAEAIHDIGLEQVARLEDEYRHIAGPVLGTDEVEQIYQRLREDPDLHYHDAAALVADATVALARAGEAVGDWFGRRPQAACEAHPIEQGALAFYSRPARDGSKPGRFFFNTADPTMWGTFQLEATTYHEGIPGHHLQLAMAQENPDLHRLLADYYIAAYNEGWGLYTERLADEMGLYSSELDRIGMLAADSMRACRLVVDTGLHALGWGRQQAIDYMLEHSPMTKVQVEGEIDRYIGNPGQALGYMMGRLEIDRIRSEAEGQLGPRFDIKDFHDTVLSTGSVPIATLQRVVNDWRASVPDR